MQDVADALGDSVAIVEKHYAGKNTARMARTHEAIRSTWENDPTLKRLQVEKYGSHKVVGIASKRRADERQFRPRLVRPSLRLVPQGDANAGGHRAGPFGRDLRGMLRGERSVHVTVARCAKES